MASVNVKKAQLKTVKAIGKTHMNRTGRDGRNHSNEDINQELSSGNYCLGCENYNMAVERAENRLKEVDSVLPPKRVKKDRIEVLEIEFPCPRELTEKGLSKDFFRKANQCMEDFFGKENWHGVEIHVDEVHEYYDTVKHSKVMSLEHAHGLATPFVDGVGVNAKQFVTKDRLRGCTEVLNEMCQREYGINYRTYGDPQHRSVEQLKSKENLARNDLAETIDALSQRQCDLVELEDAYYKTVALKDQAVKDWGKAMENVSALQKELKSVTDERDKAVAERDNVTAERDKTYKEINDLKDKNKCLVEENKALLDQTVKTTKEFEALTVKNRGGKNLFGEKEALVAEDYKVVEERLKRLESLETRFENMSRDEVKLLALNQKNSDDKALLDLRQQRLDSKERFLESKINDGVRDRLKQVCGINLKDEAQLFIKEKGLMPEFQARIKAIQKEIEKDLTERFGEFDSADDLSR